jgi:hypothetical protein
MLFLDLNDCEWESFMLFLDLMFVDHSTVHTEKSNKMQRCIKTYYSILIWSSTCFGRHTAHHQEPKTALAASGFAYVEGCWTCGCLMLIASSIHTSQQLRWSRGSVRAFGTHVRGFTPGRSLSFLGRKNPQHTLLRRESKAFGPMS